MHAYSLGGLFAVSTDKYPDRPALWVDGLACTYQSLFARALPLAELIGCVDEGEIPLCAVYAKRSPGAYAGLLGILLSGRGYVPLNPTFPVERTRIMLELSGASTLVADQNHLESLGKVVVEIQRKLTVILPDSSYPPAWGAECPQHRILCSNELIGRGNRFIPHDPPLDSIAYLLFTSGTTGTPKGIGIQQQNVLSYISAITERYSIEPTDRFSQNFELTFDLSIHDLFVCWSRGACLYVPSERVVMAPGRFIRDHRLTCWFSTPSTAAMMGRLRMLRPDAFPSLRWSLFCGEPLTAQIAAVWQQAAPQSTVENLYGPTEATIACTAYTYNPVTSPAECVHGIVPIGQPFGQTRVAVVDESGDPVCAGEVGELVLGGTQIAPGYWRDPARTAVSFVSFPALEPCGPWYRTGDLVALNPQGNLIYHGRMDDQIKIMGHRVELQEVEAVAREASGSEVVVALGWPRTPAGAEGIILFLTKTSVSDEEILEICQQRLPIYMVPKEVHRLESIPLNTNGKIDRKQLLQRRSLL